MKKGQPSRALITDTGIVCEYSIAVDKLSANWQLRLGSVQMTYCITTIFPVLFRSSILISLLHPCLDNSSNTTGVLEQWSEAATSADKVTRVTGYIINLLSLLYILCPLSVF